VWLSAGPETADEARAGIGMMINLPHAPTLNAAPFDITDPNIADIIHADSDFIELVIFV
jgi:hypothetical protein